MKKVLILIAILAFSAGAYAQKAKIYTAKEYMRNGDMKKAIIAINEATTSENTKGDGDAWFTRGEIYEKLAETDPSAVEESSKSYLKVLEVKPNYEKEVIDGKLLRIAYKSYNAGVLAYSGDVATNVKSDYDAAFNSFKQVVDIREISGGKHFASNKKFDTISGQALKFEALSAYYGKKESAAVILIKAKNNPVACDPYICSILVDLYTEKQDNASVEKILEEAKSLYPKNAEISRQEMNYYLRVGKVDVLVQKMEEAVKSDPDNAVLQYNLGILYGTMANPLDNAGNPKDKPTNSKELESKAEMAYKLAIDADPNKAEYYYNLGALYFNNAADVTKKMNAISGTTDADNKKYDALKAIRTSEFTKGLPNFQKSYDLLSPKVDKLNGDDKSTYRSTLIALQTIYEALGQNEKGDAMAKKLAELGQ